MIVKHINNPGFGVEIIDLDARNVSDNDVKKIQEMIYSDKLVMLKNQSMTPEEYCDFGRRFGHVEKYYEEMYHHPVVKEIFVSSNFVENGSNQGVPKTGSFWHSDYAFMPELFSISIIYPQAISSSKRGTYYINMGDVYDSLDEELKVEIDNKFCEHSIRKYFKIRPTDVYKPIGDIFREIEEKTPPTTRPLVLTHPVTKKKILYISEGFSVGIKDVAGNSLELDLLHRLLEKSGQLDKSFNHPLIKYISIGLGDIILWDNRSLVHHAEHTKTVGPSKSYRLTVYDSYSRFAEKQTLSVLEEST